MTPEEFHQSLKKVIQKYGGTLEHIPPKKESSGPRKVQFIMVKNPRPAEPASHADSSDTQAGEQEE